MRRGGTSFLVSSIASQDTRALTAPNALPASLSTASGAAGGGASYVWLMHLPRQCRAGKRLHGAPCRAAPQAAVSVGHATPGSRDAVRKLTEPSGGW
jgi:hypothetical protein